MGICEYCKGNKEQWFHGSRIHGGPSYIGPCHVCKGTGRSPMAKKDAKSEKEGRSPMKLRTKAIRTAKAKDTKMQLARAGKLFTSNHKVITVKSLKAMRENAENARTARAALRRERQRQENKKRRERKKHFQDGW